MNSAPVARARQSRPRRGDADAGRLEDLGPPRRALAHRVGVRGDAVRVEAAEHQVVDPGLARIHRRVACLDPADAEDAAVAQAPAQLLQRTLHRLVDVDAVCPAARRHADEVARKSRRGDDQRSAARLRHGRDPLDQGDQAALVGGCQPKDHRRHVARRAGPLERRQERVDMLGPDMVRRQQGEARCVGHAP